MRAEPRDHELVERLQSDPRAFEELYRRHVRRLTGYVATRCRQPEGVADLVAATFMAALESSERYDPARGDVLPWLIGIARHLSSDAVRYARREREALAQVAGWRTLSVDETAELDARLDAAREAADLYDALLRLHLRNREPLVLLGYVGLTPAQAAQALGISGTAFRVRVMRARRALRKVRAQPTVDTTLPSPREATT
jgi:RNA polymerase sigma-70 factor (ECF subfamily)